MSNLSSRPYRPSPSLACEACCFGRGEHVEWCPLSVVPPPAQGQRPPSYATDTIYGADVVTDPTITFGTFQLMDADGKLVAEITNLGDESTGVVIGNLYKSPASVRPLAPPEQGEFDWGPTDLEDGEFFINREPKEPSNES